MNRAYRGYLVVKPLVGDTLWITKDGFNIGSAASWEEAKAIINMLLD